MIMFCMHSYLFALDLNWDKLSTKISNTFVLATLFHAFQFEIGFTQRLTWKVHRIPSTIQFEALFKSMLQIIAALPWHHGGDTLVLACAVAALP